MLGHVVVCADDLSVVCVCERTPHIGVAFGLDIETSAFVEADLKGGGNIAPQPCTGGACEDTKPDLVRLVGLAFVVLDGDAVGSCGNTEGCAAVFDVGDELFSCKDAACKVLAERGLKGHFHRHVDDKDVCSKRRKRCEIKPEQGECQVFVAVGISFEWDGLQRNAVLFLEDVGAQMRRKHRRRDRGRCTVLIAAVVAETTVTSRTSVTSRRGCMFECAGSIGIGCGVIRVEGVGLDTVGAIGEGPEGGFLIVGVDHGAIAGILVCGEDPERVIACVEVSCPLAGLA